MGDARTATITVNGEVYTIEQSGAGALFDPIGGTAVDGEPGVFMLEGFGRYSLGTLAGWIISEAHGFLFIQPGPFDGTFYAFDLEMNGWWYADTAVYPWIYAMPFASWIYVFEDIDGDLRAFYIWNNDEYFFLPKVL